MRRWGFEKLIGRSDVLSFLRPMFEMGFFNPSENPGPEPAELEGHYRIPRWEVMAYLEKAAIAAGEKDDLDASKLIVQIARNVTNYRGSTGEAVDNYSTWYTLAKSLAALPPQAYEAKDLEMLKVWLDSKFDRGMMIGTVLAKEWLTKLLSSPNNTDWDKALMAVTEASRLIWRPKQRGTKEKVEGITAVDPYWLAKLFEKHSKTLGAKVGKTVVKVLVDRLTELFLKESTDDHAWLLRPAIEDHPQNRQFRETENVLISAVRDTLLGYVDTSAAESKAAVADLLSSSMGIQKRIGIHVVDERFQPLSDLFFTHITSLLQLPLVHEVYRLLQRHFAEMPQQRQTSVLEVIENIGRGSNKEQEGKRLQSRLVHALRGKGNTKADTLYSQLKDVANWESEDSHPDFLSYVTSWSGPGPSPYSVEELRTLDDERLIQTLNDFEEQKRWHGPRVPTIKALCDAVTQVVKEDPKRFIAVLPRLGEFKPAYQYAILNGFRDLSHSGTPSEQGAKFEWPQFWTTLFPYLQTAMLQNILVGLEIDEQVETLTPTRRWLIPVIADLIRNGTHDDYRSIPKELFTSVRIVLAYMLTEEKSTADGRDSDAMTEAINTTKGHCIEALFDFSLYMCRNADRERKSHSEEWQSIRTLFDREIEGCKGGNFEFSTLCGAYLANIHYLSSEWLNTHVEDIFPTDIAYAKNFDCALQGFAYMPQPSKVTYLLLRERGILHVAIGRATKGRHAREKLLQHICVSYLWGDESLEAKDGLLAAILTQFDASDIHEIVRFFWGIHGEQLTSEQVEKILAVWRLCMSRIDEGRTDHHGILSDLGLLTVFLKEISDEQERWLLKIAKFIGASHNTEFFVEYLEKLADKSPRQVGEITLKIVQHNKPYYDFENRYESIVSKLLKGPWHKLGEELCNQPNLMDVEGIGKAYSEYRASKQRAQ